MKILYDHTVFEFQRYGGISRYFYELITRLSTTENMDVSLFQGFNINEYAFSKHKQNYGSYWSYKLKSKRTISKYIPHMLFSISNKILFEYSMMTSNANIYHPTFYMKRIKHNNKIPIVITVYDMIYELYPDLFADSRSVIKAKKRAIKIADTIISISENTKNDLIRIYGLPESKIKVVYLASSLCSSNTLESDELKASYRITRPYILYVGDRRAYKNFKILIDSYRNHLSNYFDLVCFGGGKFKPNELKSSDNNIIQLHGSDDLLASLYKHAFCFVYPSLYEGFGIPPLEAMSMGCPVIASNTSSIPEVVGNAAMLFDPHSEKELIHSIQSLYNESTRKDLIKRGYEQEKKFSWEKMANETLSIYKSIVSR